MSESNSQGQEKIYEEQAEAYDRLITAEDADGALRHALLERIDMRGKRVADVGAGTGRLARWIAPLAAHVHLIDRAAPMLEIAARRLSGDGWGKRVSHHVADARELPLADGSVDLAVAGWVFGHFRHWMPKGWKAEVDQALSEMRRVVAGQGPVLVIETLGTGHETPREHSSLDEYFAHLEEEHGFERHWVRTDYAFGSPEEAAEVLGGFFGEPLVEKIKAHGWSRVPECTALFIGA